MNAARENVLDEPLEPGKVERVTITQWGNERGKDAGQWLRHKYSEVGWKRGILPRPATSNNWPHVIQRTTNHAGPLRAHPDQHGRLVARRQTPHRL